MNAKTLLAIRKSLQISQLTFSKYLGISRNAYLYYEKGLPIPEELAKTVMQTYNAHKRSTAKVVEGKQKDLIALARELVTTWNINPNSSEMSDLVKKIEVFLDELK